MPAPAVPAPTKAGIVNTACGAVKTPSVFSFEWVRVPASSVAGGAGSSPKPVAGEMGYGAKPVSIIAFGPVSIRVRTTVDVSVALDAGITACGVADQSPTYVSPDETPSTGPTIPWARAEATRMDCVPLPHVGSAAVVGVTRVQLGVAVETTADWPVDDDGKGSDDGISGPVEMYTSLFDGKVQSRVLGSVEGDTGSLPGLAPRQIETAMVSMAAVRSRARGDAAGKEGSVRRTEGYLFAGRTGRFTLSENGGEDNICKPTATAPTVPPPAPGALAGPVSMRSAPITADDAGAVGGALSAAETARQHKDAVTARAYEQGLIPSRGLCGHDMQCQARDFDGAVDAKVVVKRGIEMKWNERWTFREVPEAPRALTTTEEDLMKKNGTSRLSATKANPVSVSYVLFASRGACPHVGFKAVHFDAATTQRKKEEKEKGIVVDVGAVEEVVPEEEASYSVSIGRHETTIYRNENLKARITHPSIIGGGETAEETEAETEAETGMEMGGGGARTSVLKLCEPLDGERIFVNWVAVDVWGAVSFGRGAVPGVEVVGRWVDKDPSPLHRRVQAFGLGAGDTSLDAYDADDAAASARVVFTGVEGNRGRRGDTFCLVPEVAPVPAATQGSGGDGGAVSMGPAGRCQRRPEQWANAVPTANA